MNERNDSHFWFNIHDKYLELVDNSLRSNSARTSAHLTTSATSEEKDLELLN